MPDAVTQDALLDGAVLLRQPEDGYRAAIDSVFLAAAVPAESGARVFEPGAGDGAEGARAPAPGAEDKEA